MIEGQLTRMDVVQNTYSTAIVIGEKAAMIVAEELEVVLEQDANEEALREHL